jgi:predicted nucleic acid-binding protein
MTLVVDASILVAWAFDEVNAVAGEARERMHRSCGGACPLMV